MKFMLYFKGNTDGRRMPKHLGIARYYGNTDELLLIPVPFNWIVIGFDFALHYLRRGKIIRCPHCKRAI